MPPKPSSTTKKIDPAKRADKATGRVLKTTPNTKTKTPVYSGQQARDAQDKQSKKHYKNPKNTTSSSRYT